MSESTTLIPNKNGLNLSWLIKLRWGSFAGQVATVLGVYSVLEIRIPVLPLLLIVAIGVASNLAVAIWFRSNKSEVREWHLASVMSLDIVLLTLLLFLTGGHENPFSFLYLVNIALAAVALQAAPTASIIFTSSGVGRTGKAYWGAYAVSKFATEGFMQVLASELENTSKVRVNSLNPGPTNTAMRRTAYPGERPTDNPAPEDIMASYLFLMGDDSAGITGQAYNAS